MEIDCELRDSLIHLLGVKPIIASRILKTISYTYELENKMRGTEQRIIIDLRNKLRDGVVKYTRTREYKEISKLLSDIESKINSLTSWYRQQ